MKEKIQKFKRNLAAVFDDNLHTKVWHNIADWLIIALIIISTVEIFISTFDIDPALRRVLFWVDISILTFFTVEVSLRIWVSPLINPKFKGWKGRLRYCFTFHGFIDAVSTYPFYLQWLIPFPIAWLTTFRTFRVIRLFRVSRYMKSWKLLEDTFKAKKRELLISMQFLFIITLILSLILYFCEHDAQPETYDNGFSSVLWAFGQYIGDPGGFAENPPITGFGKFIACIVGLLGIAIVAVPAGILGGGFTEAIEHERDDVKLRANQEKLRNVFERKLDRPTGYQAVNFFRSMVDLQTRTGLTEQDIMETVSQTPGFRIINLAATIPSEQNPIDRLAVEHFEMNRPYGLMIDRGSKVTIVSVSNMIDPATGIFSFYLALIGGFNYISREVGETAPYNSYYTVSEELEENQHLFNKDLEYLLRKPDSWSFSIFAASGAQEPEYDTHFHFATGNGKGTDLNMSPGDLISDKQVFDRLYQAFSQTMRDKFALESDHGRYHNTSNPRLWMRTLEFGDNSNHVIIRIAWSEMLWNDKRLLIAREMSRVINQIVLDNPDNPEIPELKVKRIGFNGYDISKTS